MPNQRKGKKMKEQKDLLLSLGWAYAISLSSSRNSTRKSCNTACLSTMGLSVQTMVQFYHAFPSFALSSPSPAQYLILMLGYFGKVLLGFSNKITLHSAQQNKGLTSFARDKTGKFLTGSHANCCPKFLANTLATQRYEVKHFFLISADYIYTQREKCTYACTYLK